VEIHPEVLIGANAVLLGPIRVGKGAKIGAGAVARRDVLPGEVILAAPSTLRRPLEEAVYLVAGGAGI